MKIICIGRNYSDHAKELGNATPDEPVFFCKPDSAILLRGNPFFIPEWSKAIHYEVELVYRINRLGKHIEEKFAHRYYSEVGLGIDFTARDVQDELKKKSLPWEKAKSFDGSAVVSEEFIALDSLPDPKNIRFSLRKNGELVQEGVSSQMVFNPDQLVSYVSTYMTWKMGDLLFTGTPSGVGPVAIGDVLDGFLEDQKMFSVRVR
ncbi:MAG: fumarylacetoacetate hydrolase family protein [Flavobacteriales bacterium]|jgi:acylpyruvate hydrolase